ncbi:MAG: dihydrolipoamide dehydrogenase [Gammaproteobacteria bacterium]|jgi:dihydrolipoamide dehydrogenase
MKEITCKLAVIGAGPGGYVCAIRAAQLGLDTVIIEAGALGGACLNVGCIPSKALIHVADEFYRMQMAASGTGPTGIRAAAPVIDFARTLAWKNSMVGRLNLGVAGLLKNAGVKTVKGWATFRDGKTVEVATEIGTQVIRAEAIAIATGSQAIALAELPFGESVISSTEALALDRVPASMAIIGGGYIGLELGTAFAKLGAAVTVIEMTDRILPQYDAELSAPVLTRLQELGITVRTGTAVHGLTDDSSGLVVEAQGHRHEVRAEKVLVTVGRHAAVDGWGLEGLDLDRDGAFIRIDERCRTSMRGVYALGDITGGPMLAHRAMAQGELLAEVLAGKARSWDIVAIPSVCFTDPEIVEVGLSPQGAANNGIAAITNQFPFQANGRAMSTERTDGFVRIVARQDNHLVIGVQAVGENISELAGAFTLALEMGARLEDIAATIHAHPTRSEAFQEAALRTLGHGLHI